MRGGSLSCLLAFNRYSVLQPHLSFRGRERISRSYTFVKHGTNLAAGRIFQLTSYIEPLVQGMQKNYKSASSTAVK